MMKCGSCHGRHETVAEVRDCYALADHEEQESKAEVEAERRNEQWFEERGGAIDDPRERELWAMEDARAADVLDKMAGTTTIVDKPSDKQVKYALDLLATHEWPDRLDESDLRNMERRLVSKLINSLLASPLRKVEVLKPAPIPAGRYALDVDGEVRFYQCDAPQEGRWAGRIFLSRLYGAPGDFAKRPVRPGEFGVVMLALKDHPQDAMIRFGKETAQCGRCHSPLTVKESRERGIGPKCASKMGWS